MRITDFIITEMPSINVLFIEKIVTEDEIISFFVESIYKLGEYVESHNILSTDVPYMQVIADSGEIKCRVGNIVPIPIRGNDMIMDEIIPSGKWISGYFQGDNNGMEDFYQQMEQTIAQKNYKRVGHFYEYFLNGAEFGIDKLLTKVNCRIISQSF